jgi:hypothetical protein
MNKGNVLWFEVEASFDGCQTDLGKLLRLQEYLDAEAEFDTRIKTGNISIDVLYSFRDSDTYGHSQLKTGHPVRSAIHKQLNGRLVLRWVTTWESLLLYVLCFVLLSDLTYSDGQL